MIPTKLAPSASVQQPRATPTILDWRAIEKQDTVLKGRFDVQLPSGMILVEMSLFTDGSKRWISMPSRSFKKEDGTTGYVPLVRFRDSMTKERFQNQILDALDQYLGNLNRGAA